MTRVTMHVASSQRSGSAAKGKLRKHKVIFESITQAKKKLRSIVYFEAEPPEGYTFIPAGNPKFTSACKDICRNRGLTVYSVTTTPHQKLHGLSQQVHRIGYHFPSTVVATVCMDMHVYIDNTGRVVPVGELGNMRPGMKRADSEASQTTINTEARDVILDLFPNIPAKDLTQIITTAFQKGQRKVGTASELPLARRAQLAVVAHIRHMYTDYDNLLKKTSFQEARRQVEEATLEKLVQWRGDDENGSSELEDVFREVIVIDDDEDDEADEDQQKKSASTDRDSSIEVVSASAAADHLETRPINIQTTQEDDKDASEQEAHQGISVVQGSMIRPEDRKVDRRGFSRYDRAWDRAMNRYRERMSTSRRAELESLSSNQRTYMPFHGPRYEADRKVLETVQDDDYRILPARHIVDPQLERRAPAPNGPYYRELPGYRDVDVYHLDGSSAITSQQQVSYSMSSGANAPQRPPDILHFPDGSVFEKAPSSSGDPAFHWERPAEPVFVRGSSVHYRTQDNPRKRVHEVVEMPSQGMEASPRSHVVLPSIETPDSSVVMPWREDEVRNFTMMPDVSLKNSPRTSGRRVDDLSHGINVIDLTDDGDVPKRRRLEGQESVHENRAPVSPSGHHLHSASSLWRPSQRFASYELRPLHDTAESLGPNAVVHGRRPVAAPRHELVPLSPRAHLRADMAPAPAPAQPVYRGLGDRVMWEPAERPAVPYSTYIPEGQSVADGRYVGHTETRYVTTRDGDRHPDLDGPAWRSKARSYELERRLIDAQESRAQDFRVVETRPAYQREQRPEAGYYTEEAMTNRAAPHVHRVSGHIPVPVSDTDSDSGRYAPYPSRRKGALPASAVRRYRFEREKTFRATQDESRRE